MSEYDLLSEPTEEEWASEEERRHYLASEPHLMSLQDAVAFGLVPAFDDECDWNAGEAAADGHE